MSRAIRSEEPTFQERLASEQLEADYQKFKKMKAHQEFLDKGKELHAAAPAEQEFDKVLASPEADRIRNEELDRSRYSAEVLADVLAKIADDDGLSHSPIAAAVKTVTDRLNLAQQNLAANIDAATPLDVPKVTIKSVEGNRTIAIVDNKPGYNADGVADRRSAVSANLPLDASALVRKAYYSELTKKHAAEQEALNADLQKRADEAVAAHEQRLKDFANPQSTSYVADDNDRKFAIISANGAHKKYLEELPAQQANAQTDLASKHAGERLDAPAVFERYSDSLKKLDDAVRQAKNANDKGRPVERPAPQQKSWLQRNGKYLALGAAVGVGVAAAFTLAAAAVTTPVVIAAAAVAAAVTGLAVKAARSGSVRRALVSGALVASTLGGFIGSALEQVIANQPTVRGQAITAPVAASAAAPASAAASATAEVPAVAASKASPVRAVRRQLTKALPRVEAASASCAANCLSTEPTSAAPPASVAPASAAAASAAASGSGLAGTATILPAAPPAAAASAPVRPASPASAASVTDLDI